ncbi:MAG: sigma-70 family RNA polymerase sigma factor [Clostridia bacterium]|nr:sigma-70 family RNA polymerase sigma factor [Clostridia bacterium]
MNSEMKSLIERTSAGDDTAFVELCEMYDPLIKSMTKRYVSLSDLSEDEQLREDFSQEAILALYRAASTYQEKNGEVSFGLYAKICVRNALVSELRRINRKKRSDRRQREDAESGASGRWGTIDESAISNLLTDGVLSGFERDVLDLYVAGMKVRDMAEMLGKSSKSVSNAVYRIKSKLRAHLKSEN